MRPGALLYPLLLLVRGGSGLVRRAAVPRTASTTARWATTQIFVVGKKGAVEDWISTGCGEFEKRLKPVLDLETVYLKSDDALVSAVMQAKGITVCLDEKGESLTSRAFEKYYFGLIEKSQSAQCNFVIGGFAGLPDELRNNPARFPLLSLSKLTWTHQMARLLLIEQIYRAHEIRKGSSYHKD
jgi:23S rRNA (pseudouridine1915-N3)-methyltransferase